PLEQRLESALGGLREKRAEQALEALPEGVALTDSEGRVLLANPALCALIGADDESVRGSVLQDHLPWESGADADAKRSGCAEVTRTVFVEWRRGMTAADGVLRVARSPFPSDGAAGSAHAWLVRDITQQRLAEEAREQFVYSATHELRTPLANIKAYAE